MEENTYIPPAQPRPEYQQLPPVSVVDWVLTILVLCIPLVNLIMLFVWGFGSGTNPSKANFAKAALLWMLIGIILSFLFMSTIVGLVGALGR